MDLPGLQIRLQGLLRNLLRKSMKKASQVIVKRSRPAFRAEPVHMDLQSPEITVLLDTQNATSKVATKLSSKARNMGEIWFQPL
jgi:uncharacterized membrane protein